MPPIRSLPVPSDVLKQSGFLSLQERMSKDLFAFDAEQRKNDDALALENIGNLHLPEDASVTGTTGYEGMLGDGEAPDAGGAAPEAPDDYGAATEAPQSALSEPASRTGRTTGLMSPTLDMPAMAQPRRQPVYDPTQTIDIQGEPDYDPSADMGTVASGPTGVTGLSAPNPGASSAPAIQGKFPEEQARIYQQAKASGLDDEGARVLVAVSETEGGARGAVGDNGHARGVYQFHDSGEFPSFAAWARKNGIEGDPAALAVDPEVSTRYAAEGYLGQAIKRGRELGYSGAELATYVQRTGQRSVSPGTTGENYTRLFGQGTTAPRALASSDTQRAAEGRVESGEMRTSRVSYPLQQDLTDPDKWAVCGPLAAMGMAAANGTPIDYETAKAKARAAGWTPQGGMAGPSSQVALLNSVGVPTHMEAVNWEKVRQDVRNGNPVMLSSPGASGHYMIAQGIDDQGRLDLGNSTLTLKGGRRWMTPEELRALGPIGAVDTAIYMDNPSSPTPSRAATATGQPSAAGNPNTIIRERDALALTAGAPPAEPPFSAPADASTSVGASDLDAARTASGGGQGLNMKTEQPGTADPIQNPDGSVTTERSITVTDPQLNGGRATNIPTVWGGRIVSDDEAVQNAAASGMAWPSFGSIDEAVQAAEQRSQDLGAGRATSVGGATVPPEVQNALPWRNRPVRGGPIDESGGLQYRQPLSQQPELPPDLPPDPDQGPHELIPPGAVSAPPIISPLAPNENPGVSVTASQPAPPQIEITQGGPPTPSAQWTPVETRPLPVAPPATQVVEQSVPWPQIPGLQPVLDAAGNVVAWVQGQAQAAGQQISENMAGNRAAVEQANIATGAPDAPSPLTSAINTVAQTAEPFIQPMADTPYITSRINEIQTQAAAELGRSPIDVRVTRDLGWRARHPDLAEEYDQLQDQLTMALMGQVGDMAGPARNSAEAVSNIVQHAGPRSEAAARVPGVAQGAARGGVEAAPTVIPSTVPTPGVGSRIRGALDANAEKVAALDARAAERGSTVAPGVFGVSGIEPGRPEVQGMRPRVIPPNVADELDFPVRLPEDPAVIRAIEAAGGTVDERGVTLGVTRAQSPTGAGQPATRGMVFYEAVPEGGRSSFVAADDPKGVGGSQVIPRTPTRFRSPLILSDAPGDEAGFARAMEQLGVTDGTGHPLTPQTVNQRLRLARAAGPEGSPARAQALKDLVARYGGEPELIDDLLAVRGADASESAWAIKENIVATNARKQGHDGVITVQQQMGGSEYQKALETAVEAHPQYQAQKAIVDDLEAQRTAMNIRYDEMRRVYGPDSQQMTDLYDPWNALHDQADAAARKLANIHDRLIDEVDVPVPHKITELADTREARNPTPGEPTAALKAAYRRAKDAEARFNDLYQGAPRSEEEFAAARRDVEEANAALDALMNETDTPPGYTLRSDIPRRPAPTYDELVEQWNRFSSEYRQAIDDGDAAAQQRLKPRLDEINAALKRTEPTTANASAGALPASQSTDRLGAVNRALGQGVASAVSGGVGAQVNQEMSPDDPYAGVKGFAVGALAPTLIARGARRVARAAGREADGLLATMGHVPEGGGPIRRPTSEIPGQKPIKLSPAEEVGRLRLDKFPEEVRDLIQQSAGEQGYAHAQRRGVLPDAVVKQMAQSDAKSVDDLIKGGRAGKQYSAEETLAVRNAVASQANVVRDLSEQIAEARANNMTPDLLIARRAAEATKLNGLVQVAEGARAEAGRTLRAYAQQAELIDLNPQQAIQQIYKRLGGKENAEAAVDAYTKLVQDGADPIKLAKFWAKVEGGKITGSDLFSLFRRFNMLSGPRTLEVNALSGATNIGYEVATQAIGQASRGRLGEAAAEVAAPFKAMGRAFGNMAETMWHGVSAEQAARGDIPRNLSARTDNRAAKAALTVAEVPDRLNAGVDQFFRTMTEDWAATRLAHQQARDAHLTPRSPGWAETVARNLEAIRDDPSKFPQIKEIADHVTFSEEPGPLGQGLEGLRRKSPLVMNVLAPFIRTPYNIASRAVDLSPLGVPRTAIEAMTGKGRGRENISRRVRDNVLGVAAAYWAYDQAQQGNLTGAGPDDPEKIAELRATGWQPYSVRINNPVNGKAEYWSYANFAPFSLALSSGAAAAEAQKYAKPGQTDTLSMLADGAGRTAKVVTDMTVLAGIGAVIKSIQDPERYGAQWLTQFLQTLIPAGSALNTVGQMTDPTIRRAERDSFGNQVRGGLASRVPDVLAPISPIGTRQDVPAARQPLGEMVPNDQTGIAALNPFRPTTERPDRVYRAFIDAGVDIGPPPRTMAGKDAMGRPAPITLTPSQQRQYQVVMGQEVRQRMGDLVDQLPAMPREERQKRLQTVLRESREAAADQFRAASALRGR